MQKLIASLTTQHDWRLTLLAVLVCVAGLATTLHLFTLARETTGTARRLRLGASIAVGGTAIWATHFITLMASRPGLPVANGIAGAIGPLILILVVAAASAGAALSSDRLLTRALSGALIAGGATAVHFISLGALNLSGVLSLETGLALFGVIWALGLGAAAGGVMGSGEFRRTAAATLLGSAGILGMHFLTVGAAGGGGTEMVSPAIAALSETRIMLAVAMTVTAIILVAAAVTALTYWSHSTALKHLREAIDAMPDGLGFFDANDRLLLWNARYAEVNPEIASVLTVGLSFRDIIQIGLDEGLYADAEGREAEWVAERMAARQKLSSTMEQRVAGDRWLRVQDRRTAYGGIVTVVNDITDLKRDAEALAVARDAAEQANRAKSEFLANMSHEIRTPLNGVIGVAQVLAKTELSPQQREMLDLVHSSSQTLQSLLSDILDLARVESGRMSLRNEPFDLSRAVTEAAQLYAASARDKGLQFFVDIAPEAALWIDGDIVRLKQILTNLVSNAVKFTSTGFVSLTAARGPDLAGAPTLRFTVEDTGIGFDAAARDRLFSRFEQADGAITRRFGGSGLGLAICRQLAEMMDGQLDCESEPDGGSAFILTLPLREVAAPALVEAAAPVERAERRLRVLLADDHPTNRKVVELILAQIDVELHLVEDGAEAVAASRAAPFDVILMDMQMPVMDGLTATREIRLHECALGLAATPVVMLTANALPEHIAATAACGADRHLAKPFSAAELIEMVLELGAETDVRTVAA